MGNNDNKVKVINITGWGRNGSTLLGKILGEAKDSFYGGEIRNIWGRVLVENRLCGCGSPINECSLWKDILNKAFNGIENIDIKKMISLSKKYDRVRYYPHIFSSNDKEFIQSKLNYYISNHEKLFEAIKDVTNAKVIIDSSKSPFYGYLLTHLQNIDLYFVHLIRDPRGIAYSRQKKVVQPDKNKVIFMSQYDTVSNSLLWNTRNIASEQLCKKSNNKHLIVNYKDFIQNPKESFNNIMKLINEPVTNTPFISDTEVKLGINHSAWGNPDRFHNGIIKLKLDEEWKENLNFKDKVITTLLTFPLLKKYNLSI